MSNRTHLVSVELGNFGDIFQERHFHENPDLHDHLLFLEAALIFLLNFSCFCVSFTKASVYKKYHNVLLAGLIISHSGNGLSNMIQYILHQASVDVDILKVWWLSRDIFYALAISYTLLLSIDRYLAIKKPFYYGTLTSRYILFVNLCAFFVSGTYKTAVVLSPVAFSMLPPLIFLVTVVLAVVNSVLYWEVKKQCGTIIATSVHESHQQHQLHVKNVKQRQFKTLKMCVVITVTYTLFWTPFVVLAGVYFVYEKEKSVWNLKRYFGLVALLDCIVDAIIYMKMNKDVKKEFYKKTSVIRMKKKSRVSVLN